MTKRIKIEDIEVDIPVNVSDRISKATKRTILGGLMTRPRTENVGSIDINLSSLEASEESQLMELVRNYSFINTTLVGISRMWDTRFVIDSMRTEYSWYDRVVTINGTLQLYPYWNYVISSMERPLHDRWKYLIMEDFSTDAVWPYSAGSWAEIVAASPFYSTGYGKQVQDIPWSEEAGEWYTMSEANKWLVGGTSVFSFTTADTYLIAGWDWWENYETKVQFIRTGAADWIAGIAFRYQDTTTGYRFHIYDATTLRVSKNDGTVLWTGTVDIPAIDTWYNMKVECIEDRIRCYFNGKLMCDFTDDSYKSGRAGLYSYDGNSIYFDDFRVTLLPPVNFNLPASVDWTNQYTTGSIATAHGSQKGIVAPDGNIEFKMVNAGDDSSLYMPLDEGSGDPRDRSKYSNAITVTGTTWVIDDDRGDCLEFNGSSDVITIDDNNVLDTDLSAAGAIVWDIEVKFDAVNDSTWHAIIMKDNCYHIQHNSSNQIQLYVYESGTDSDLTWTYSTDLEAGVWYRFTFVWIEADFMGIFVDGDLKASTTPQGGTLSVSADELEIGGNDSNGRWFDGRLKNARIYKNMHEDMIFGFDRTPATVFVFDDMGTTDARYRTTTLMYDLNVMTRVYDRRRNWTGKPVVSNGLVTLSFPEISGIVWPMVHVWADNNWVPYGSIQPIEERNGLTLDITDATSYEWAVEELTDQYCKIRVTWYMDSTAGLPEGSYVRLWLTVRNGYPGVLIESDRNDPSVGWLLEFQGYGSNGDEVITFLPEDTILNFMPDILDTTTSYSMSQVDDNWLLCYKEDGDFTKGMFVDSIRDEGGNMWIVTDTGNVISDIRGYGKYGGVFYIPSELSLFREADTDYVDVAGTGGTNDQTITAGYTGDGYYDITDFAGWVQWNVGFLDKGTYVAIFRIYHPLAGGNFYLYVDDDATPDGDIASVQKSGTISPWTYLYLMFYTDGTNDIYLTVKNNAGEDCEVDSFGCMSLGNLSVPYGINDIKVRRV